MKQRPTLTISFLPSDDKLWEFIQMKKESVKISTYIRELIRKDMLNTPPAFALDEEKIVQQIILALENNDVIKVTKKKVLAEIEFIDDEAKNTILNLF